MTDTEPANPDDHWGPTRRPRGRTRALTPEQLALADDLHTRALALRVASEDGLSIREAVNLAAVQLGMEPPTSGSEQP
ncbi:hypothetical protein [Streptomyces alboflavus]|uniref:hypothetical protein n=1 Tax=Streptomyces alboflavus TaxID=67267 RepID=UPI0004C21EEC|nr:hypothetical protein [Streptomyces alboflavus]